MTHEFSTFTDIDPSLALPCRAGTCFAYAIHSSVLIAILAEARTTADIAVTLQADG